MRRKKSKISGKLMAIFIAVVMMSSIAGFVILDSNTPDTLEYNGYNLERDDKGIFSVDIESNKLQFNFHPSDVVSIPFTEEDISIIRNSELIMVTSDIGSPLQRGISLLEFELENNLRLFDLQAVHGFTEEDKNGLQVITCDMATEQSPVLYIVMGNSTDINQKDYCFTISARNEYDIVKVKDALLYRILGII